MVRLIAVLLLVLSWLRETIPTPAEAFDVDLEGDEHEFSWNEHL